MDKRALITGITGQDGSYLSEFLINKGYEVYGAVRRTSSINTGRLSELDISNKINLVGMDLAEITNIQRVIEEIKPDEVYNLAAQSFVQTSFDQPIYTSEIDAIGVTRILETIRMLGGSIKFYQASTSEMFGKVQTSPQNEETPFYPRSPYGVSKLYGHWMTEKAFNAVDTEIEWVVDDGEESGRCKKTGNVLIDINKDFNRPAETDYLLGDATKAKEELNWKPQVNFNTLIEMMVKKDLDRVENDVYGF